MNDQDSETIPVRPAHRFATGRLAEALGDGIGARLMDVRQMRGGQSNPTFLLVSDRGEYVLRKQPPGTLLPSAHAIDREYRVLAALAGTDVPVPRPLLYDDDPTIIGTPFYVMERLKGRIFRSPNLPELPRPSAPAGLSGDGRYAGQAAPGRLGGPGPGRFRQARQLLRASDRPLDQAMAGVADPRQPVDRQAGRMAARPYSARRSSRPVPWRFPASTI